LKAIQHALLAAAYRHANGQCPPDGAPVDPALDCMTEALSDTCRLYGIAEDTIGHFLLTLAIKLGRLEADIPERLHLRQVEHQINVAIDRADAGAG
jgi:hypothetical protein